MTIRFPIKIIIGLPNGENKIKAFDELLKKLPLVNRETLKVLFGHLMR